jgi:alpha-1,2-mannosyltransferase
MAAAIGLGLWLFGLGLVFQWRRLALELSQGLGFADPACTTGYCDYSMFWMAGFLLRHGGGGLIYDHARYAAAAARVLPYASGWWPFVYPPTMLLPARALSWMPLVAGYYGFCVVSVGLSVFLLRRAGVAWWCIGAGVVGPAAMWNLYLGQFGLLCGAMLVAGLAWAETAPRRAGGVLALLCIKPQYALLVPAVVLAGRHWRVMFSGCCGLVVVLALSALWGGDAWVGYLGPGRAAITSLLTQKFGPGYEVMGTSVLWMARSFGATLGVAAMLQAVVSTGAVLAVWRLWRAPVADAMRRASSTVFLTLLASPYGFTDDLAIYSVLLPMLGRRDAPWRNAMLAWLWVLPAFVPRFVAMFGFLPAPLLVLGALGLAWTGGKKRYFSKKPHQKTFVPKMPGISNAGG